MRPLLKVSNVSRDFVKSLDVVAKFLNRLGQSYKEEIVHAVDDVSFEVFKGEVIGIVGESGCGKSTLGKMVAGILPQTNGTIHFDSMKESGDKRPDALKIQMIFQDPFSSLNPRKKVFEILTEAPIHHGLISTSERRSFALEMLTRVGLDSEAMERYPHQFSGGQRQRIGIARALAVQPDFLVCDESVAALDVSIQAQVLNLFMRLREELNLTYLFISHDLGVVEHLSDRVVIMYFGRVVEVAPTEILFSDPNHPYTQALLAEVPRLETRQRKFAPVKGEIPSPIDPPAGCHFHPRCPKAFARCHQETPALKEIEPNRFSACHLND